MELNLMSFDDISRSLFVIWKELIMWFIPVYAVVGNWSKDWTAERLSSFLFKRRRLFAAQAKVAPSVHKKLNAAIY